MVLMCPCCCDRHIQPRIATVARTLQKALPDLIYISLTILLILPILAVVLCLFKTPYDDGWLTYRGQHMFLSVPFTHTLL